MFHALRGRPGHYLLLILVWSILCLVNLGAPGLWDIDEGNNADCAREMYDSGNWIVPTFNYLLRTDKPALLYWGQITCYHVFGVNEFSARLPSALAALLAVLAVYELGRKMFGAGAGFLAGFILLSTFLFSAAAHFANPDALLCLCTVLTMLVFWIGFDRGGDRWLWLAGITSGFGMLAKGPVSLVLPGAVIGLFLLWSGQLRRLFRPSLVGGILLFVLVAGPWYAWVIADTRGEFFRGFFLKHNVGRFLEPMENHRGPVVYYLLVLLAGFAPWSIFFALAGWHGWMHCREQRGDPRYRFLLCWIAVYLVFFSLSGTKLPNYVLPLYPPVALLVAHFLDRWRSGAITLPAWGLPVTLGSLACAGVLMAVGLLIGGGVLAAPLTRGKHLPGLENWAIVGIVPVLGACVGWCLRHRQPPALIGALGVTAVVWLGIMAGWGQAAIDQHKAPRPLGEALLADEPGGDIDIACYEYFQPSLVFYTRHSIIQCTSDEDFLDWLKRPAPAYVFLPASVWERLRSQAGDSARELARHRDLYRGIDAVLIRNRG